MELLRGLSRDHHLPDRPDRLTREVRRRLAWTIGHELPLRRPRDSDRADLDALASALTHCELITCDAFMADVVRRARLDARFGCELFTGRRRDVLRLRDRLQDLSTSPNRDTARESSTSRRD
jgi:hypothetical protein